MQKQPDAPANTITVLTFYMGQELYGVDIERVKETKGTTRATPIPNSAHFVAGVINLRGEIVPVADLRRKFNLKTTAETELGETIILRLPPADQGAGQRLCGIIVDAVEEVRTISHSDIQATPDVSGGFFSASFVDGVAKIPMQTGRFDDKPEVYADAPEKAEQVLLCALVDIEKLMQSDELRLIEHQVAAADALV
jgi:purine-binding chemotaxis protein CheW